MRIYLCPALMDWVVFLVQFAVLYGAGERGLDSTQCAWLGAALQIAYMLTSPVIGAVLTPRNARILLQLSNTAAIGSGALALLFTDFRLVVATLTMLGVALSVFFNAFQTFMRGETSSENPAKAAGFYTFAWSAGAALGFLSSGFFYRLGPGVLVLVDLAVGLSIHAVLQSRASSPSPRVSPPTTPAPPAAELAPQSPAYVVIGWSLVFTAMFVQRPVQTFFPAFCAKNGVGPMLASLPLLLFMLLQAVGGGGMIWRRAWLYRRQPLWLIQVPAALVFMLLWATRSYPVALIGISLLGLYTGFAYFSAVCYASNSSRKAFNIGMNEFMVGLGSLSGLFISGALICFVGTEEIMYLACAAALAVAVVVQITVATIFRRCDNVVRTPNSTQV